MIVGYGLARGSLVDGCWPGIALAMSLIPEEFPVVLTVFLALGAWRIARSHVLTRRVPAIEALGCGHGAVRGQDRHAHPEPHVGGAAGRWPTPSTTSTSGPLPPSLPPPGGIRRCWPARSTRSTRWSGRSSSCTSSDCSTQTGRSTPPGTLVKAYPLSDSLLAMTHVWRVPGEPGYTVAAKGAPEAIADLCRLDDRAIAPALLPRSRADGRSRPARAWRGRGTSPDDAPLPDDQRAFPFAFVGLIGLADPIRPTVPAAVAECYRAGIRVVMLTGDYPVTAQNIARQVGLRPLDPVITGPEIDGWTTPPCGSTCATPASSRACAPSRSCAWCGRSRPTARSWR